MSARKGPSRLACGGGTLSTIASSTLSTPCPVFALIRSTSSSSARPSSSLTSSSATSASPCAAGKSTLLRTGITTRPLALAARRTATVWACTPWVASTSRIAPLVASKERWTSDEKSTWPGVSIRLSRYRSFELGRVKNMLHIFERNDTPGQGSTHLTATALTVMPRSRSTLSLSRTCRLRPPSASESEMTPVSSSSLSDSVLLP